MKPQRQRESPRDTPFIREMRAALARRVEAGTLAEKRQVEREMEAIMRAHLRPDPELLEAADVARGTLDRKVVASGERD